MLKNNRLILFPDVLRSIFRHLLRVCIVAACITVVLTAYFYRQDRKKTAAQAAADAENLNFSADSFTEEELTAVQNAIDAKTVLDATQTYYDNSFIQKVDPYAVQQTTLYFRVKSDSASLPENLLGQEGTLEASLRTEYYYYVSRGDLGTDVADALGIEAQYITELISVENDSSTAFSVILRASDLVPDFADTVVTVLEAHGKELESSYYGHALVLNDQFESVVRIDDYYNRQKNSTSELNTCANNLKNLLAKLDQRQVAYYNAETGSSYEYLDPDTGKAPERYEALGTSGLVKRAVIALILGAVLACVLELFLYMYSGRIESESDFTLSLGIPFLGDARTEEHRKITLVKLQSLCKREQITDLVLTSSLPNLLDGETVKKIAEALEGIQVHVVKDPLNDSWELADLLNAGNVILAEQVHKSRYGKVRELAESSEKNGVKLWGVVDCRKSR